MIGSEHTLRHTKRTRRPGVTRPARRGALGARGGFSLLELLLVVALVMLLLSSIVFNFSNLARGSQLEEGTVRLETLMRFARAQAANSGRKVQLVFGQEASAQAATTASSVGATGEVRATYEPDPLRQPGCYSDLHEAQWHVQELNDLVQVESVTLLDASSSSPVSQATGEDENQEEGADLAAGAKLMSPITFYPDGSSDSAEIIVAARSEEDVKRMAVRLVGITGSISHQLLSTDFDELSDPDIARVDRRGQTARDRVTGDWSLERDRSSSMWGSRPANTSTRAVQPSPRATVGETNGVDQID